MKVEQCLNKLELLDETVDSALLDASVSEDSKGVSCDSCTKQNCFFKVKATATKRGHVLEYNSEMYKFMGRNYETKIFIEGKCLKEKK